MNTDVEIIGASVDPQRWFQRLESLWSRFDPESSLSQLNRMAGRWVVVPPLLHLAIRRALAAAQTTGGAFDPTVLPALINAGYGRSFEQGPTAIGPAAPAGRWREVKLAPGVVYLPSDLQLDLGGIGKGLAVDHVIRRLHRRQPNDSILVNAGGDLAFWTAPGERPWQVEVADPFQPEQTRATFSLYQGAAATSSTLGRRWGEGLHHLIDPRTGRPTRSEVVSATVFASGAGRADVLAKVCIIVGAERALPLLARQKCQGLLVTRSGKTILTPGLEGFLHAGAE